MAYITVDARVDIDTADVMFDITTNELKNELKRRNEKDIDISENLSDVKVKKFLADYLKLREWEAKDESLFLKAIKEKLF
jgi:hypothetical protein